MGMKGFGLGPALALLLSLFSSTAWAEFGEIYVTPASPMSGEALFVNVRVYQQEYCDAILSAPGYPQVAQEGNSVTITFFGARYESMDTCAYMPGIATRTFGSYAAGSYTLTVKLRYGNEGGEFVTDTLGVVPFAVAPIAAEAVPVPVWGNGAAIACLILLLFSGVLFLHRRHGLWMVLPMALLPVAGHSSDPGERMVEVLPSTAPGAPSAEQIIDYYARPVDTPPLGALRSFRPASVDYLLPVRAEGAFREQLQTKTSSPRAKLERYVVMLFPEGTDVDAAVAALQADPFVESAGRPLREEFSSATLISFNVDEPADTQYGRDALNIDEAWALAGGYALIATLDTGLYVKHTALAQFSPANQYLGGNFVPAVSKDISLEGIVPNADSADVDERRAMQVPDTACNPNNLTLQPQIAGHGTHAAGLTAANGAAGLGVRGTCKHCGIAMRKIARVACEATTNRLVLALNSPAKARGLVEAADMGAPVANMSNGAGTNYPDYCQSNPGTALCLAITYANSRDVVMVAASGNGRQKLDFPARDPRIVSAGGLQSNLALWDDSSVVGGAGCPPGYGSSQCGSAYTTPLTDQGKQEVMASAKSVFSTTYPGYNWNADLKCGDQFPSYPAFGNGVGHCTGTSMSAPQIAGVIGLLRSINPLVVGGDKPTAAASTIRHALASTTFEAQASSSSTWSNIYGYGRPDAAAAARKMLGKVAGVTVRNRATPLFRFHSDAAHDFVDVTSPQMAVALQVVNGYRLPTISTPPEIPPSIYPQFPHNPGESVDTPHASVFVLTTEYRPRNEWPDLIPLYLMDRPKNGGTDYLLATSKVEIEAAHTAGYNLRTIQGYIYQPCTPESTCVPPAAQKLWRQYKIADNDCAVFLDSEKPSFEAAGYTAACPTGETKMIGYAYPATDSDGDGLPDGFEYVVGTNPNAADSDGDGISDSVEFPLAGIATGDPCMGGSLGARNCGADRIFKNGFEGA
jgi:hypothetical protein